MKNKVFATIATIISKIPDIFLPKSVEKWRDKHLPGVKTAGEQGLAASAANIADIYGGMDYGGYSSGISKALAQQKKVKEHTTYGGEKEILKEKTDPKTGKKFVDTSGYNVGIGSQDLYGDFGHASDPYKTGRLPELGKLMGDQTDFLKILEDVKIGSKSSLGVTLVDTSSKVIAADYPLPVSMIEKPSANLGVLLAALAQSSGSGGGSTTVNNVTVAPSTSNTVSSVNKSENTYGTVDPYTSAAGAYG